MILGIEVHSEFVVEFSWPGWLQEDFHLNVGAECLFSPASVPNVFASWDHSSDVWRILTNSFSYLVLRVMLLEIEVESGVFFKFFLWVISLKVQQQLPFSKRFRMKEKFDGEGCAVFWSFCSWQIQEGWALKESSTTAEMICTFLVTRLKVHYFKGLFSNPFHGL